MPGTYTLSFAPVGFQPKDAEIKVEAGSESERKIELEPVKPISDQPQHDEPEPEPAPVARSRRSCRLIVGARRDRRVRRRPRSITGISAISQHNTFADPARRDERARSTRSRNGRTLRARHRRLPGRARSRRRRSRPTGTSSSTSKSSTRRRRATQPRESCPRSTWFRGSNPMLAASRPSGHSRGGTWRLPVIRRCSRQPMMRQAADAAADGGAAAADASAARRRRCRSSCRPASRSACSAACCSGSAPARRRGAADPRRATTSSEQTDRDAPAPDGRRRHVQPPTTAAIGERGIGATAVAAATGTARARRPAGGRLGHGLRPAAAARQRREAHDRDRAASRRRGAKIPVDGKEITGREQSRSICRPTRRGEGRRSPRPAITRVDKKVDVADGDETKVQLELMKRATSGGIARIRRLEQRPIASDAPPKQEAANAASESSWQDHA